MNKPFILKKPDDNLKSPIKFYIYSTKPYKKIFLDRYIDYQSNRLEEHTSGFSPKEPEYVFSEYVFINKETGERNCFRENCNASGLTTPTTRPLIGFLPIESKYNYKRINVEDLI